MSAKKKSPVADALTADKPRAARVMDVIAAPPPALLDLSAPLTDDLAIIENKDVETITAEVIQLQQMGNRCLLEIGKRLIAAKAKLSHGGWLPFLERVNISPRFAQRYMRLAREWTNATSLSYLGMSKALALLALPDPDERDAFISETHVVDGELKTADEMSVRELEAAIKARQEAENAAKIAESKVSVLEARLKESERDAEAQRGELARANRRLELANAETEKARAETQAELQKRIAATDELSRLKNKPTDVAIEKVVDEQAIEAARKEVRQQMQADLDTSRAEAAAVRQAALEAETARQALDNERRKAEDLRDALEVAQSDADAAKKELERVKADAKAAPLADSDLPLFGVLFEQVKAAANQMHGILLKRSDEKQESMRKALLSLSEQLRKAAET